ncbi:hypothetical protein QAD02_019505 [Eretmocerus hayati]|uniref:Uncharacterized protein n=1 Tax=Eretmocerus hayati TaxID=131215 RepID=A0ACC2PKX2_9HYME|nr:hypothetical protein QAD02_019505 [Eretmocerus hayati]
MGSTSKLADADGSEVTVRSRSGRVCKKSSKLMYLDSTDGNPQKKKKTTAKSHNASKRSKKEEKLVELLPPAVVPEECTTQEESPRTDFPNQSFDDQQVLLEDPPEIKPKMEIHSEISLPSNSETESDSSRSKNELQTPDYTTYDEESQNSDEELLSARVKKPEFTAREVLPCKVTETKSTAKIQNSMYNGYKLWSSEMRTAILAKYPSIENSKITDALGDMWTTMPVIERNNWHQRAQQLVLNNESLQNKSVIAYEKQDWLNSCSAGGPKNRPVREPQYQFKLRTIELYPIDVAAHLKLLGESLTLIGGRLKYYNKPVVTSDCITVLLDSLLCAMGSLICLLQEVTGIRLRDPTPMLKTLENISYIMPGL